MQKEKKEQALRDYFQKQVNPILSKLVVDLLIDQPEQIIDYMKQWLDDKGRQLQKGESLKQPKAVFTPKIEIKETPNYEWQPPIKLTEEQKDQDQDDSDQEEGQEDEEFDDKEFEKIYSQTQKQTDLRSSVSQEVYGQFNKKTEYKPKVVPKSEDQKKRIKNRLMQSFMFSELGEKDKKIVIDAMEEKQFKDGDFVIKQGDDGDVLYLVDQGILDCFRKVDNQDKFIKQYNPGDAFGELALLYNAPRAATIKSKGNSICFSLDRECFNNIVKESSVKRRERYEETLKKVDLLSSMDPYERTHLCDGLKEQRVTAGDIIIRQGDKGDKFYIVDEGQFRAIRKNEQSDQAQEVMKYQPGEYFGEIALIRNIPRQATIEAITDGVLVYLDFNTFKRLMGPLENILKRNEDKYAKYWKVEEELLQMEALKLK